jgi:peptidyl-prolyl cis-trans isomerase A (cyclophilin A)
VSHRCNPIVTCLSLVALAAVVGCGGNGDGSQPPATAITSGSTTTGGEQDAALKKRTFDGKHPVVVVETSLGNITLELDREKAPVTVDNFLSYVSAGHYEKTIIHQVFKGQGFLGGGYGMNLVEKPVRLPSIFNEAHNGVKNLRGTISMARRPDAVDSATCQFFINVADNPNLDFRERTPEGYGYCVFGKVTEGLDVVDKIADTPVHDRKDIPDFDRTPVQPIVVTSIRQIR